MEDFKALFEAIEREQALRGNLVKSALLELPKAQSFLVEQDYWSYTAGKQHEVWAEPGTPPDVPQIEQHAAREYLEGFESTPSTLPNRICHQFVCKVSKRLERRTGWNTTPVSGFHARGLRFLRCLPTDAFPRSSTRLRDATIRLNTLRSPTSFTTFLDMCRCTRIQCLRTFWPDMVSFACASRDEAILERIGQVFWYTVEFGLIRQEGRIKVYGSGLISSNGDGVPTCCTQWFARCARFDLDEVLRTPVKVDEMKTASLFAIRRALTKSLRPSHTLQARIASGSRLDD